MSPGGTYYEPFLGSGALFFALRPQKAVLSDANAELIDTFIAVRDDVDAVITELGSLRNDSDTYYAVRASFPTTPAARAARFIYLNKTCFNGLYRVNLLGQFNVPFGRHGPNLVICNEPQLRQASATLAAAKLMARNYYDVLDSAVSGDLVYLDPPYITAHSQNGFIEYNARIFSWRDQHNLADTAASLVRRGVNVVISNADHSSIIDCYSRYGSFQFHRISRWSTIAAHSRKRYCTTELVIVSSPEEGP